MWDGDIRQLTAFAERYCATSVEIVELNSGSVSSGGLGRTSLFEQQRQRQSSRRVVGMALGSSIVGSAASAAAAAAPNPIALVFVLDPSAASSQLFQSDACALENVVCGWFSPQKSNFSTSSYSPHSSSSSSSHHLTSSQSVRGGLNNRGSRHSQQSQSQHSQHANSGAITTGESQAIKSVSQLVASLQSSCGTRDSATINPTTTDAAVNPCKTVPRHELLSLLLGEMPELFALGGEAFAGPLRRRRVQRDEEAAGAYRAPLPSFAVPTAVVQVTVAALVRLASPANCGASATTDIVTEAAALLSRIQQALALKALFPPWGRCFEEIASAERAKGGEGGRSDALSAASIQLASNGSLSGQGSTVVEVKAPARAAEAVGRHASFGASHAVTTAYPSRFAARFARTGDTVWEQQYDATFGAVAHSPCIAVSVPVAVLAEGHHNHPSASSSIRPHALRYRCVALLNADLPPISLTDKAYAAIAEPSGLPCAPAVNTAGTREESVVSCHQQERRSPSPSPSNPFISAMPGAVAGGVSTFGVGGVADFSAVSLLEECSNTLAMAQRSAGEAKGEWASERSSSRASSATSSRSASSVPSTIGHTYTRRGENSAVVDGRPEKPTARPNVPFLMVASCVDAAIVPTAVPSRTVVREMAAATQQQQSNSSSSSSKYPLAPISSSFSSLPSNLLPFSSASIQSHQKADSGGRGWIPDLVLNGRLTPACLRTVAPPPSTFTAADAVDSSIGGFAPSLRAAIPFLAAVLDTRNLETVRVPHQCQGQSRSNHNHEHQRTSSVAVTGDRRPPTAQMRHAMDVSAKRIGIAIPLPRLIAAASLSASRGPNAVCESINGDHSAASQLVPPPLLPGAALGGSNSNNNTGDLQNVLILIDEHPDNDSACAAALPFILKPPRTEKDALAAEENGCGQRQKVERRDSVCPPEDSCKSVPFSDDANPLLSLAGAVLQAVSAGASAAVDRLVSANLDVCVLAQQRRRVLQGGGDSNDGGEGTQAEGSPTDRRRRRAQAPVPRPLQLYGPHIASSLAKIIHSSKNAAFRAECWELLKGESGGGDETSGSGNPPASALTAPYTSVQKASGAGGGDLPPSQGETEGMLLALFVSAARSMGKA